MTTNKSIIFQKGYFNKNKEEMKLCRNFHCCTFTKPLNGLGITEVK